MRSDSEFRLGMVSGQSQPKKAEGMGLAAERSANRMPWIASQQFQTNEALLGMGMTATLL